jgi:hypothetical protein
MPLWFDLWWVIVNVIHDRGWVCVLTMVWVGLCDMSLDLWCAGVKLGGGGWWRDEGQVEMCRTDGSGAVKDGREAWTEGLGGRITSCGGWHLGHRQAQVYMGVTVLTESRRRTYKSSGAQRTWVAGRSRMAVTRVERRGMRMEYAPRERVWWFASQNHRWRV